MQSSYKLQPTGENKPMKKEQGFSLIELLIVVAIIAIIAAIAVPSMLTARMAANESSAIQGCRTVCSAEMAYAAVNNQNFAPIADLVEQNFLDNRFLNTEGFNGYVYVDDDAAATTFAFEANPVQTGSTGRYNFTVAQDLVVRYGTLAPEEALAGQPIGQSADGVSSDEAPPEG
ncbi:MAG: prepilin-type N-terminal cleavage/methylation domain-containing protein [Bacteroidales bacterium]|nr:prepilin-type N-terminal cleavage/methylation domain-containing protein [Bacteroidales bacterium]